MVRNSPSSLAAGIKTKSSNKIIHTRRCMKFFLCCLFLCQIFAPRAFASSFICKETSDSTSGSLITIGALKRHAHPCGPQLLARDVKIGQSPAFLAYGGSGDGLISSDLVVEYDLAAGGIGLKKNVETREWEGVLYIYGNFRDGQDLNINISCQENEMDADERSLRSEKSGPSFCLGGTNV
jgi:hypothetical protein